MNAVIKGFEEVVRRRLKKPIPVRKFRERVVRELVKACGTTGFIGDKPKSLEELVQELRDYFRVKGVKISEDDLREGLRDVVAGRVPEYDSLIRIERFEYIDEDGRTEERYVIRRVKPIRGPVE